jgi:hypothetical protein
MRERLGSPRPETTVGPLWEIGGKQRSPPKFSKTLIMATGTSVLVTPNLEGLEVAGATGPRKRSCHLSRLLRLANSLLTPGVGGAILGGLHDQNHMVHPITSLFSFLQTHAPRRG